LRLVAWSPSETRIDAEQVEWVHVSLAGGVGLTIWPGHAPLLAETVAEAVRYADSTGTHVVDLDAGILHVEGSAVTIFLAQTWSSTEADGGYERLAETLSSALPA
jgi:F0F1-type ATP synthase epsilon subunit